LRPLIRVTPKNSSLLPSRRVARGGDLSPLHPKILQFARVFEKKHLKSPLPPKIFLYNKFENLPLRKISGYAAVTIL